MNITAEGKEERKMKQSKFPPGWNSERVKKVLAHYETQSEEEAAAEDEAAFKASEVEILRKMALN